MKRPPERGGVRLAAAGALVFAVLASAGGHLWLEGRNGMRASDAALAAGDPRAAIAEAKRAAQSRLPGSPFPGRGRDRLASLAREAEAHGDADTAVAGWRALRAACASTTLGGPGACARDADDGIARLAARAGATDAQGEDDPSPPAWLPVLVVLGAIALVVLADRGSRFLSSVRPGPGA